MTREEINAFGNVLQLLRDEGGLDCVVIAIGAAGPSIDCRNGNMIATVRVGPDTETSEAVYLDDAISLARGKCVDNAARRKRAAEEAKKEKAS